MALREKEIKPFHLLMLSVLPLNPKHKTRPHALLNRITNYDKKSKEFNPVQSGLTVQNKTYIF